MRLDAYRLFLVDMDDTLFEERAFVLSGLRAVADFVEQWGLCPATACRFLLERFERCGRDRIFNHLLAHFNTEESQSRIAQLVSVYRCHRPDIRLYPGAEQVLELLRARGRVVVVTDGLAEVQERKFKALGLESMVDQVVYCHAAGFPKPDARALAGIVCKGTAEAVLIGDRPDHDLAMAANLGIDSVRVRTGRFARIDNTPWVPIADLASMMKLNEILL